MQFGDVVPVGEFYLYFIVSLQMLMGVVYTTSIFARGLAILNKPKPSNKDPFWKRIRPKLANFRLPATLSLRSHKIGATTAEAPV